MNDRMQEIVQAYADNDMNVSRTSRAIYKHRNTAKWWLEKLRDTTEHNPFKFHDLAKMVGYVKADGIENLLNEIARLKTIISSENRDYWTGYISALSVVEGMVAEFLND